ncbi:MAG: thioredoxin-dependent thiol peroxidase [Candidatus Neomarinimicrobiota bacterium]|jgi:peroxiredoxin Q/BCP
MELLHINELAPDFKLPDKDGKYHRLSDFLGKRIVLYFYPKDDTPGCTTEACSFRDDYKAYTDNDIVIIGISKDNPESHQKFIDKYELPFLLLSDENKETMKKYGAWGEKNMYGKISIGVIRKTFLIDEEAKIIKIYGRVRVKGHSDSILKEFGISK